MGNTFSDFIGAILGAALVKLFIYMTSYDGIITGDDKVDNSFFVKHLSNYMPFMEAIFIALGCLVPIFIVGVPTSGASIIPLDEFPIIQSTFFIIDK